MIVVDASVIVLALTVSGLPSRRASLILMKNRVAAPHLIDLETANAAKGLERSGDADHATARGMIDALLLMTIERYDHRPFLDRIWELRHNLSVYDAAYVALAEHLDSPLVTADTRLAGAPGIRCPVELVQAA